MLGVRLFLECRQVVQQGRLLHGLLAFDSRNRYLAPFFERLVGGSGGGFLLPFPGGGELHDRTGLDARRGEVRLKDILRRETLVFPETAAYHCQRGCLHAPQRIRAVSGGHRDGLRGVDTHEPIGLAAGFGRVVEVVVLVAAFEPLQPLADGLVRERADPEAVERRGAADVLVQVAEDQLTLASGIRRHDDTLALAEQPADDLDLRRNVAVGFIALVGLDLTGNKFEHRRDDGQVVAVESLDAITVRQGGLHQMPERPCYVIAVSRVVADLSFRRFHDAGDLTRHARFLCNNCFHTELIYLMWI